MAKAGERKRVRFGIAEWYGIAFSDLSSAQRRRFAAELVPGSNVRSQHPCPFKPGAAPMCGKPSGVCSIRKYVEHLGPDGTLVVSVVDDPIRATCPSRFHQDKTVYAWAGEILLKNGDPVIVPEVGFLEPIGQKKAQRREVGRIDLVLLDKPDAAGNQNWAALEIQAVYFSGKGMDDDFVYMANFGEGLPFPRHSRRPDYRSSGPKRLLPQLQTKVPTLSRWGKRMAVVVDQEFFNSLDPMQTVDDVSSADIAWFIVQFEMRVDGHIYLKRKEVVLTTLTEAVSGLTGGRPTTQEKFLERLVLKASKNAPLDLISEQDSNEIDDLSGN